MAKIVVFSGAGLSQESGIPTFRDAGGLWENYAIEDVATPLGWERNPQLVLDFYAQRFWQMSKIEPNAAHYALAQLSQHCDVIHITQNIDTLLEKAGVDEAKIWHIHGRIDYHKCSWHYGIPPMDAQWQCHYRGKMTKPVQWGDRCACGQPLRPDVVWFGEAVDLHIDELYELMSEVEIFIGIGTSAQVYPAANLLNFFKNCPHKYFIDPHPDSDLLTNFTIFQGKATDFVPNLVKKLIKNYSIF